MQGASHLMVSWYFAEASGLDSPRDRRIVAWSGFAPDIDVLAYVAGLLYYRLDKDLAFENVWQVVHHRYTHGLSFVLVTGIVAWFAAARGSGRVRVALLAMIASALHNFFDVVAGGPTWPIYPIWPFSDFGWTVSWSWPIGEWPNIVILFACLAVVFVYAKFARISPLECFGDRADAWFIGVVHRESDRAPAARSRMLRWVIWLALAIAVIAVLAPLGFRLDT